MTIRADARSLHARPWERRYRHAFMEVVRPVDFKLWAGSGEQTFFFTRSPGGHPGEPVGKIEDAPILNPRWEMQGSYLLLLLSLRATPPEIGGPAFFRCGRSVLVCSRLL